MNLDESMIHSYYVTVHHCITSSFASLFQRNWAKCSQRRKGTRENLTSNGQYPWVLSTAISNTRRNSRNIEKINNALDSTIACALQKQSLDRMQVVFENFLQRPAAHVLLCVACADHCCTAPGCYSKCSATFQCLGAEGWEGWIVCSLPALRCNFNSDDMRRASWLHSLLYIGKICFLKFLCRQQRPIKVFFFSCLLSQEKPRQIRRNVDFILPEKINSEATTRCGMSKPWQQQISGEGCCELCHKKGSSPSAGGSKRWNRHRKTIVGNLRVLTIKQLRDVS